MGRIPKQTCVTQVPRGTTNGDEGRVGIVMKIMQKGWHQRQGIPKILIPYLKHQFIILDLVESQGHAATRIGFERIKKRAGKTAIGIGQGNHHELAPGPDVQSVWIHGEIPGSSGRYVEFFVPVGQIGLAVFEAVCFLERVT